MCLRITGICCILPFAEVLDAGFVALDAPMILSSFMRTACSFPSVLAAVDISSLMVRCGAFPDPEPCVSAGRPVCRREWDIVPPVPDFIDFVGEPSW